MLMTASSEPPPRPAVAAEAANLRERDGAAFLEQHAVRVKLHRCVCGGKSRMKMQHQRRKVRKNADKMRNIRAFNIASAV